MHTYTRTFFQKVNKSFSILICQMTTSKISLTNKIKTKESKRFVYILNEWIYWRLHGWSNKVKSLLLPLDRRIESTYVQGNE